MADDSKEAQGKRLRLAREHAGHRFATGGWAAVRATTKSTVSKDAYLQHENGTRSLKVQAQDYADAYRVPAGWLVWGDSPPDWAKASAGVTGTVDSALFTDIMKFVSEASSALTRHVTRIKPLDRRVPVVGQVAAGLWHEVHALEIADVEEYLPVEIAGYERAALYALKVVGPSMNKHYPPGRFVIVAPAHETGVRRGDHVIVERQKTDAVEVTIKEVVVDGDGRVALWPRSHDPAYQDPIYLRNDPEDQTAARIIGVVIGDYSRRERPPAHYA